jgi:hypothetical protein
MDSAASMLEGPLGSALVDAVDDIDRLVRRIRTVVFESLAHPAEPPQQVD